MVRQAVLVLVLVGAAFAGGAAINGPGLAWLQHNLIGGPMVVVDGPGTPAAPARQFPTANPPLLADLPPTTPASPPPPLAAPAAPPADPLAGLVLTAPPPPAPAPAAAPLAALDLPDPSGPGSATPGARPATPTAAADLPPLDLAGDSAPAVARGDVPAKADPGARRASAGGLDPSPLTGSGRDWGDVRRRLKALGVSRYSVEADLDGRVRFSCVIPVDGLRAVGHHFEADGDDEFQAVEATLRRVALWRATEAGRADP